MTCLLASIVVLRARPFGAQLDDRVVQVDADAAAHADDHRLAVHRLEPAARSAPPGRRR